MRNNTKRQGQDTKIKEEPTHSESRVEGEGH